MKQESLHDVHARFLKILDRSIEDPHVHGLCQASFSSGAVAVTRTLLLIDQMEDPSQVPQRLKDLIQQVNEIAAATQRVQESLMHPGRGFH